MCRLPEIRASIGITGAFVLLLACINFINLSTARTDERAKEVGIRKAVGSMRSQLMSQFFVESMAMAMAALTIAMSIVVLALPSFNQLASKQISIPWNRLSWWIFAAAATGALVITLATVSFQSIKAAIANPVKLLRTE